MMTTSEINRVPAVFPTTWRFGRTPPHRQRAVRRAIAQRVPDAGDQLEAESSPEKVLMPRLQIPEPTAGGQRRVRVLLADDDRLFRHVLKTLIEGEGTFTVVGEADTGDEAVRLSAQLSPDIVLLDMAMPQLPGLSVVRKVAAVAPKVNILLLTSTIDRAQFATALQFGARGIVLKEAAAATLFRAIHVVIAGQYWIDRDTVVELVAALRHLTAATALDRRRSPFSLTPGERIIITAVVAGDTNRTIAGRLSLSEATVKHHLTRIFDKLGVSTRLELALLAINHGLLREELASAGEPTSDRSELFQSRYSRGRGSFDSRRRDRSRGGDWSFRHQNDRHSGSTPASGVDQ